MRADKMPGSVPPTEGDFSCAAVVVAGGASRRLNHVPKASLSDGTNTLLDCALEAVAAASPRVVVGPESLPLPSGVLRTREDPPFSGPAAAIHAGLECIAADCERSQVPLPDWCLILGVDTPRIAPAVQQLIAAARAAEQASVGQSTPAGSETSAVFGVSLRASISPWWVFTVLRRSDRSFRPVPPTLLFVLFLRRLNPVAVQMSAADTADVDTWEQAQALGYTTSLWSSY